MEPRVSIIVPCLNERRHVEAALRSLLSGTVVDLELVVVDGCSTDGTRAILARLRAEDPRLRVIDNRRRTTPAALNLGLRVARGAIILRADAHARYPRDYVEVLTRALDETGADLVGCPADAAAGADTDEARIIALAARGRFATASPFREARASRPADTVPFGCWRREVFARVGGFDERLLRNQDNEHASRILDRGGRVYLTAATRVSTIVRATLVEWWRHAAKSGMWNAFTQRLCPYTFRWRHFLPGVFFAGVLLAVALAIVGFSTGERQFAAAGAAAVAPYALALGAISIAKARAAGRVAWAARIALATFGFHFIYGYGIAKGWLLVATGGWRAQLGVPNEEALR
jgi:glycosyltransferase involved in cell wall biosynthesis